MGTEKKDVLLIVTVITGVVSLIGFILFKMISPILAGTILTERYLSSLRMSYIFNSLSDGALFLFIFSCGAAVALVIRSMLDRSRLVIAGILLYAAGIILSFMFLARVIQPVFNKPEVSTVNVTDKDTEYKGGKFKRRSYILHFSNGARLSVDEGKYRQINVGDDQHIVMCGSKPIAFYSPSEYRLP